jgi:hypothetical protein
MPHMDRNYSPATGLNSLLEKKCISCWAEHPKEFLIVTPSKDPSKQLA